MQPQGRHPVFQQEGPGKFQKKLQKGDKQHFSLVRGRGF